MWIESMNNFEIQCITKGLQIDEAGLSTKIQSQLNKTNEFYEKAGMTLDSKLASSTSCALFWMKGSWLGMWVTAKQRPLITLARDASSD